MYSRHNGKAKENLTRYLLSRILESILRNKTYTHTHMIEKLNTDDNVIMGKTVQQTLLCRSLDEQSLKHQVRL